MVQDELRRINTIDNQIYLDTVEVIGSIPVAPIASNLFRVISFPSLSLIHPICPWRIARGHAAIGV